MKYLFFHEKPSKSKPPRLILVCSLQLLINLNAISESSVEIRESGQSDTFYVEFKCKDFLSVLFREKNKKNQTQVPARGGFSRRKAYVSSTVQVGTP